MEYLKKAAFVIAVIAVAQRVSFVKPLIAESSATVI